MPNYSSRDLVRVDIHIGRPELEWAKAEAKRLGVSYAYVIRRAVETMRTKSEEKKDDQQTV